MTDREIVLKALEEAQQILAEYLEPGQPRNAEFTIERLMLTLDNDDLADAQRRLREGWTYEKRARPPFGHRASHSWGVKQSEQRAIHSAALAGPRDGASDEFQASVGNGLFPTSVA
jgi:hypothetical protein